LIGLLLMPILMGGGILIQVLLADKDRHYAVIDRTPDGAAFQAIDDTVRRHNETRTVDPDTGKEKTPARIVVERVEPKEDVAGQRLELSDRVRRGELTGFLDVGPEALTAPPLPPVKEGENPPERPERQAVRLQTNQGSLDEFGR